VIDGRPAETLGAVAHPGGLLVDRPELIVGVVRAVSRLVGLEVELLARRPLDRRTALQRQADIRAARTATARRPTPAYDEGVELRFGWLDAAGRAHWVYPSASFSSGGDAPDGMYGPSLRVVFHLPPLFDAASVVLAWPEIGFPETVVRLSLPDRDTVARHSVSIWEAPVDAGAVPDSLSEHAAPLWTAEVAVETGRTVAAPRVLHRGADAVVVLTRLTAIGAVLSMEVLSLARGDLAGAVTASAFPPHPPPTWAADDPVQIRRGQPGASVAVLHDTDAFWLQPHTASTAGGDHTFENTGEFTLVRPDSRLLDLIVVWRTAGLPEVRVSIPIGPPRPA
jgi:hypothetical protein